MDLVKLDKNTWLPTDLIEGYDSLIWTERYSDIGDFQLTTPLIAETMQAIPEGSLVAILESNEVMWVESHDVGVNADGVKTLTTKGRSFESFLERRAVGQSREQGKNWKFRRLYTNSRAAALYLWTSLVSPAYSDDYTKPLLNTQKDKGFGQDAQVHTPISNYAVSRSINKAETVDDELYLAAGPMYGQTMELLNPVNYGLRNVRPPSNAFILTSVSTSALVTFTNQATNALRIDIYDGYDRTTSQNLRKPIVFRADADHLKDLKYFFTVKDFKGQAIVDYVVINDEEKSSSGVTYPEEKFINTEIYSTYNPYGTPFSGGVNTGLGYCEVYVDAGEVHKARNDPVPSNFVAQKAKGALAGLLRTKFLEAATSIESPYVFNTDYYLGDKVTVIGEYGITMDAQVVEYVRTEDMEGTNAYPTLAQFAL